MQTKLTLRLEDNLIEMVKQFALKNNLSLSKLTEMLYLKYMNVNTDDVSTKKSFAEKYSGILKDKITSDDEVISEYLIKKHT